MIFACGCLSICFSKKYVNTYTYTHTHTHNHVRKHTYTPEDEYSSIPGNRNWQIETADWNLDVRLDILGFG